MEGELKKRWACLRGAGGCSGWENFMSGVSFDDIFLLRVTTGRLPGSAAGLCGLGELAPW